MIVKKPSIFIYTHLADEAILREVCAGVEEEGVFYEITEFPDEGRNIEAYLSPTKEQCRKVGANSARAIKKQPFK